MIELYVSCDGEAGCGIQFHMRPEERVVDELGTIRVEFKCPKCGKVYPVMQITKAGLDLREQLRKAKALPPSLRDAGKIRRLTLEMQPFVSILAPDGSIRERGRK